jgi:hypothetical protein
MGKNIDAQVFVESDADTVFWKAVFAHFAPNLKLRFYPSGGETPERGCDRLEEIFPLFVYFVAKRKINADCAKPVFSKQAIFQKPLSDFSKIMTAINDLIQEQIETDYAAISETEYNETAKELNDIYGINETNTWIFIRGHDLQDKVVFNLLNKVTRAIVDRKIAELKTKIPTEPHFDAILKAYQNHLGIKNKAETETETEAEAEAAQEVHLNESRKGKVNTLLNDAFRFAITDTTCFPMQKIGDKIQYIATHH